MNKNLWITLLLLAFCMGFKAMADDAASNTDGSFVGKDPQTIDSSFSGDISNQKANYTVSGDGMQNTTDGQFVGEGSMNAQNTYFAGQSYQQQVGDSTVPAFAQDNTQTPSDGVFVGQDTNSSTDGTFVGDSYGK